MAGYAILVHSPLVRHYSPVTLSHYWQFKKQLIKIDTAEPEIAPFFIQCIVPPFQNLVATLPTMPCGPSDITGGNLSDYMQLPLEPQKALYSFFT